MSSKSFSMSMDEFKLFHSIDRSLYSLLVDEFLRDPVEAMQVMAFWIWLERAGFRKVVSRILALPIFLVNELADEAIICLKYINDLQFLFLIDGNEISLTQNILKEEISLQFFHENRDDVLNGIGKALNEVCTKALNDIMDNAMKRNNVASSLAQGSNMMMSHSLSQQCVQNQDLVNNIHDSESSITKSPSSGILRENRTMFVTFSKGYPVAEWEVKDFFTRIFGDCVESIYMQEVKNDEQALFARIVFHNPSFINFILNGMTKAKFTINGKHVWMRKFVPKRTSFSSPPPMIK
ncbi:hypothetical protein Leryth_026898 [Lithospermum erythrorhizon]|uniref:RRM domain-containing protein n=1 Tax=Lithospermum erythrorhizon TaxID=34254 RepID=A0AAV3QJL5_LITER|nr:hypothetical protein Leryth_026898 [Lithospermum erythrorhizon]